MRISRPAETFRTRKSAAITVDWVVLTAAVIGLGIALLTSLHSEPEALQTVASDRNAPIIATFP